MRRIRQLTRRQFLFVIGGVVVLVGIAAIGMYLVRSRPQLAPDKPTETVAQRIARDEKQLKADGDLQQKAAAEIKKNDPAQADQLYKKAIDGEASVARKVQLYVDQSSVYYGAARYTEALATGKKAEAITTDKFVIADWLSRLYEDQKDYKNAAVYYKLAGESVQSSENHTGLKKPYYDQKTADMTALIGKAS